MRSYLLLVALLAGLLAFVGSACSVRAHAELVSSDDPSDHAHAELVSSDPSDWARLAAAPATITLVFSEELNPEGNLITVTTADGVQVDVGDTTLDLNDPNRATLTVSLKPGLGDGTYTVNWQNTCTDGHAEDGTLGFVVDTAAAVAPGLRATGIPAAGLLALAVAAVVLVVSLRRRGTYSSSDK